jgi:putative transcriptional regulator
MRDMWFERTLVLLCQHDEQGALGVVINRIGPVTIEEVFERLQEDHEDLQAIEHGEDQVWWGGPVGDGAGFVVWKGQVHADEGWNIGPSVAVSPSVERLAALAEGKEHFHLCLGYAGWGPGQLEEEIEAGSWIPVDVDPEIVFQTPLSVRYERALACLGLAPETVWMQAIDE